MFLPARVRSLRRLVRSPFSIMGDLPRWIDDAIVDSVAMTTAYTEWVRHTNALALLWEEQHVPYVGRDVLCKACVRCRATLEAVSHAKLRPL